MNWLLDPITKHYADFNGRATRKEYWMFVLLNTAVVFACMALLLVTWSFVAILGLYFIATFIPSISIAVRRLHDTGRSGWWLLLSFIPYVGGLIVIIFECLPSQAGANKYGPNPYGIEATAQPVVATQASTPSSDANTPPATM